jgi:hypothetical protein
MLLKALSWFFIISGSYYFLRPGALMRSIQRKTVWQLRKLFFIVAFIWGAPLLSVGWNMDTWYHKLFFFSGIIALVKSAFFLTSKASGWLIQLTQKATSVYYRIYAVAQTVMGILIIWYQGKQNPF